jgi:hypothetical protein
VGEERNPQEARSKHSLLHADFLFGFILTPKGGRHISPKLLLTFLGLHGDVFRKTGFFEEISVYCAHMKDLMYLVRRESVEVFSFKGHAVL